MNIPKELEHLVVYKYYKHIDIPTFSPYFIDFSNKEKQYEEYKKSLIEKHKDDKDLRVSKRVSNLSEIYQTDEYKKFIQNNLQSTLFTSINYLDLFLSRIDIEITEKEYNQRLEYKKQEEDKYWNKMLKRKEEYSKLEYIIPIEYFQKKKYVVMYNGSSDIPSYTAHLTKLNGIFNEIHIQVFQDKAEVKLYIEQGEGFEYKFKVNTLKELKKITNSIITLYQFYIP